MPDFLVHQADVPEIEGHYPAPFDTEKLSIGKNLGRAAGSVNIGLWQERIPPGRRTSFTHAHSDEEELIYVLKGECVMRVVYSDAAAEEMALRAGHTASFPAGTGIAHTFINRDSEDCIILCFGERKPGKDRAYYPDDPAYNEHRRAHHPLSHWTPGYAAAPAGSD